VSWRVSVRGGTTGFDLALGLRYLLAISIGGPMTDMHADLPDAEVSADVRAGDAPPPLPRRISSGNQAMAATLRLRNEAVAADRDTLERVAEGLRNFGAQADLGHPQREVDRVIARWRRSGSIAGTTATRTVRAAGDMP
jgi:hypothetical protein